MSLVEVLAPSSGSVIELLVVAGDQVQEGQEVLIIESMKMEIPVEAPATGIVLEVAVTETSPIDVGDVLMRIERNLNDRD